MAGYLGRMWSTAVDLGFGVSHEIAMLFEFAVGLCRVSRALPYGVEHGKYSGQNCMKFFSKFVFFSNFYLKTDGNKAFEKK